VTAGTSWLDKGTGAPLFAWLHQYTDTQYRRVGVVDISSDTSLYRWDDDAAGYSPRSSSAILVFERRPT